ncbi:MAG: DUF6188 family protein [Bifidobacteriaceae bacterium]|jgi:hypothetical protein|nr:DUF6188 family protein [Bifidobacteriaceae bacterium]
MAHVDHTSQAVIDNLPINGCHVIQLQIDFAVTLVFDNDSIMRIEQDFTIRSGSDSWLLRPEGDPAQLAPVLPLARGTVSAAAIRTDGSLVLIFANGESVEVPPATDFEAWHYSASDGAAVVSGPGGNITSWNTDN